MQYLKRNKEKIIFWIGVTILSLLLVLNLKEILCIQVWRHDEIYYIEYLRKLKAEGRWINYFLIDFLKAFPAHASALLDVSFFGGFIYIASAKLLSQKKAFLFTLLLLQLNPLYAVIHWPGTILPAHFSLFLCAYLSKRYRYEFVLALAGILFHGTFNNLYNLIPLLFIREIKTSRQFFRFFSFWVLFYVIGYAGAQVMTKAISGQFIQIGLWRHPNYATSLAAMAQNLKRVFGDLSLHIHVFTITNFVLCILAASVCLWKKLFNRFQLLLLFCVGLSCYGQAFPIGIGVVLRTVYPLYAALLMPFCFLLLCKKGFVFVLSAILFISTGFFADNINSLRYYNRITNIWIEHLQKIPNDLRRNNKLIFLANNSETRRVEQHLKQTMQLNNKLSTSLGVAYKWAPCAISLGYQVTTINKSENNVNRIKPKWLGKCNFRSNELYQWAIHEGTVVVRFNPKLLKKIKSK